MMLFGMFKKGEPELPAVPVKDLQGYLYDEYERVQLLQAEADKLKEENDALRKTVEEQRALSVLVAEGKRRLETAQRNEAFAKERTETATASLQRERERNGELAARIRKTEADLKDAKKGIDFAIEKAVPEIQKVFLCNLVSRIDAMGPNTSKKQIVSYLQSILGGKNGKEVL